MFKQLRASLVSFVILTVLVGGVYPVVITAISQTIFPHQANGSLITNKDGQPVGSELIGQYFSDPRYFWGRLSAISVVINSNASYSAPYAAFYSDVKNGVTTASAGSNYGPLNPALIGDGSNNTSTGAVKAAVDALHAADPDNKAPIPVDLVTASASGLDPDISPAGAKYQVHRVAKVRGLDDATVQQLVDQYTTGRSLAVLGEPHVNVLKLNLALDAVPGQIAATPVATQAATAAATPGATTAATSAATASQ